jgi:predicted GH43/DUF377 family glycosyl hydrolase
MAKKSRRQFGELNAMIPPPAADRKAFNPDSRTSLQCRREIDSRILGTFFGRSPALFCAACCALLCQMLLTTGHGQGWKIDTDPVLTCGEIGSWDDYAILSPTIFRLADKWWMLYEGMSFDANGVRSAFGVAQSKDRLKWSKHSQNPLFTPLLSNAQSCSTPSVARWRDVFWMIYLTSEDPFREDRPLDHFGDAPVNARLARSTDGLIWDDVAEAKLPISSNLPASLQPCLYAEENLLHLWWVESTPDGKAALVHSVSRDGFSWSKPNSQATSEIDPREISCSRIYPSGDFYLLTYVAQDKSKNFFVVTKISRDARNWAAKGPPEFALKSEPMHRSPIMMFDRGGARLFYSEKQDDNTYNLRSAFCDKKDYVSP